MNGVPYDVAARMSPVRRMAFIVAFGELKGHSFDWDHMRWKG